MSNSMFTTNTSISPQEIDSNSFNPETAGPMSKGNRENKLIGSTGDTSIVFLDKEPMGRAANALQILLEKEFGSLKIGEDFISDLDNAPSSPELGFKRIEQVHSTIGALQVIDAKTEEEWKKMATENNSEGTPFNKAGIAKAYDEIQSFKLDFKSIKLTPNGMVIIQLAPSEELLKLRKNLQGNGAKLKYANDDQMKSTAITLGYFPNIQNATEAQLTGFKKKFNNICTELPSNVVSNLRKGVSISSQNVSYAKFARNDLSVAETAPLLSKGTTSQLQLCDICNSTYPATLVGNREEQRSQNKSQIKLELK